MCNQIISSASNPVTLQFCFLQVGFRLDWDFCLESFLLQNLLKRRASPVLLPASRLPTWLRLLSREFPTGKSSQKKSNPKDVTHEAERLPFYLNWSLLGMLLGWDPLRNCLDWPRGWFCLFHPEGFGNHHFLGWRLECSESVKARSHQWSSFFSLSHSRRKQTLEEKVIGETNTCWFNEAARESAEWK